MGFGVRRAVLRAVRRKVARVGSTGVKVVWGPIFEWVCVWWFGRGLYGEEVWEMVLAAGEKYWVSTYDRSSRLVGW